jgi:hypothetical protein
MSTTSVNPVQNKVITSALNAKGVLVTSISASSTDSEYPSAKCIYNIVGTLESQLQSINSGTSS